MTSNKNNKSNNKKENESTLDKNDNKNNNSNSLNFNVTEFIKSSINSILNSNNSNKNLKDKYSKILKDQQIYISYNDLKEISTISKNTKNIIYLQDLLKGSSIYYPPKIVQPPTPEQIAKKQYLEKISKEYEYSKMIKNISKKDEDKNELASFKTQLSIAVNILVTFFTLLVVGMYLGNKWLNSLVKGMIVGLVFGIGGVAAEVWLFVLRGTEHELGKEKSKKTEEKIKDFKIKRRTRQIKKEQDQKLLQDTSSNDIVIN
ncbi:hypothetical protein DICPUDRAFT_75603 [Dictyostelium purpureum]|uniref:Endoplasmic reticulum-based factor for assembly of V-ATPase n=1 Tax=Dictyostelium purpureum TaxID=5786 RepID=F0ZB50_DICPU|nr:uncharacterized protein DICPUDRAFT_75603 [Dictyostelium purpureum]EGC38832.1 hypothetical protein DICPUDRAFT_75603 [Dictyostelium purpureum]|eukprot:XP_003284626.1 hypothetical protein DICPUDRAFT_75603 [Dictyostelium purpureum]